MSPFGFTMKIATPLSKKRESDGSASFARTTNAAVSDESARRGDLLQLRRSRRDAEGRFPAHRRVGYDRPFRETSHGPRRTESLMSTKSYAA